MGAKRFHYISAMITILTGLFGSLLLKYWLLAMGLWVLELGFKVRTHSVLDRK